MTMLCKHARTRGAGATVLLRGKLALLALLLLAMGPGRDIDDDGEWSLAVQESGGMDPPALGQGMCRYESHTYPGALSQLLGHTCAANQMCPTTGYATPMCPTYTMDGHVVRDCACVARPVECAI